jgi:hypothetical protein
MRYNQDLQLNEGAFLAAPPQAPSQLKFDPLAIVSLVPGAADNRSARIPMESTSAMPTMPTDQPDSTPKPSRAKMLALPWLVLLGVDLVHAWLSERWLSWGHASSTLLAFSGLLTALSLHLHEHGRRYDVAGKAAFAAVLLAVGSMVVDILTTTG